MAYYDLEPPDRPMQGLVGQLLVAIYNSSGRYKRQFKIKDFVPKRERMFMTKRDKISKLREQLFAAFGPKK